MRQINAVKSINVPKDGQTRTHTTLLQPPPSDLQPRWTVDGCGGLDGWIGASRLPALFSTRRSLAAPSPRQAALPRPPLPPRAAAAVTER